MTSPDSHTPAVLPDEEHIGENVETARPRASGAISVAELCRVLWSMWMPKPKTIMAGATIAQG